MAKVHKGPFYPKHPEKYLGDPTKIVYRSSWELTCMMYFDKAPAVTNWASEPISIPYRNPLNGRHTIYIPDFLIAYQDKSGRNHVELLEIKPAKEVPGAITEKRMTPKLKLTQALNMAKWQAAAAFCAKRGIKFRVVTENELFGKKKRR